MSDDLRYPIRLKDVYPTSGIDAAGESVEFSDVLSEGELVGPASPGQADADYVSGQVVRRDGGLWIDALDPSDAHTPRAS